MNGRERCIAAIGGRKPDRVPVFPLLTSLPAARLGITFREFATNGRSMAEAQLYARSLFGLDAITACSDAFRICADLGGDMVFPEDSSPRLRSPLIAGPADLARLSGGSLGFANSHGSPDAGSGGNDSGGGRRVPCPRLGRYAFRRGLLRLRRYRIHVSAFRRADSGTPHLGVPNRDRDRLRICPVRGRGAHDRCG